MNRLVIFDLDGVLFESRDMHFETLNRALREEGYDPISYEQHLARFNGLPTRIKLDMLGIVGQNAANVQRAKQVSTLGWVMQNVRQDDTLVTLFRDLRLKGWKIAVASNAITVTVIRALQLLGLVKLCDFIVAGDEVEKPKPNPEMYLLCMKACDAAPLTTIIVEDSPVGREGARATGASVICVAGPDEVDEAVRHATEEV